MFHVTNQPIDLDELVRFVTDPEAGAVATFIGTTRNNNEGRQVIALDYEGYPEMAEKELRRIGEDAKTKWPICRMAITHRIFGAPRRRLRRLPLRHRGDQKNRADLEEGSLRGRRSLDRHTNRTTAQSFLTGTTHEIRDFGLAIFA
jgi:hypothetical protein